MASFAFLPRKVQKKVTATATSSSVHTPVVSTQSPTPGSSSHNATPARQESTGVKPKGKGPEKLISDDVYATLGELALSDYAIWADADLRGALNTSEDGYIPLALLLQSEPFRTLPSGLPSQTVLARAIRGHGVGSLEVRMCVTAPPARGAWHTHRAARDAEENQGGFEVRRLDSAEALERVGHMSQEDWNARVVYVENIPPTYRSVAGISQFLNYLLDDEEKGPLSRGRIQYVYLPSHHLDPPGAVPKCKGFALVTFASVEDAELLLTRWKWKRRRTGAGLGSVEKVQLGVTLGVGANAESAEADTASEDEEDVQQGGDLGRKPRAQLVAIKEAMRFNLRMLAKMRYDVLQQEYLAYRTRLIASMPSEPPVTLGSTTHPAPNETSSAFDHVTNNPSNIRPSGTKPSFPHDCLVFVRNVDPGMNKTALRDVLSAAFKTDANKAIDYVDFTKGMDTCHVRLSQPAYAQSLVRHFDEHAAQHANAADANRKASKNLREKHLQVELVTGRKEEIYWEKVPEKIKQTALSKTLSTTNDASPDRTVICHPNKSTVEATGANTGETDRLLDINAPFPPGCLLYARNVHPETNKTTLRTLFGAALGEDEKSAIDYVDYSKGMNTCHLRLSHPKHAQRLLVHFTATLKQQQDGLDHTGVRSIDGAVPITLERVEGKREEVYWGKVPPKLRMEAVKRLVGDKEVNGDYREEDGRRKRKRR